MAIAKTLEVVLTATTAKFSAGIKAAQQDLSGFAKATASEGAAIGKSMEEAGKKLIGFSAGFAALGAASAGAALGFDREFTKITTLVGISADEVERMKGSTLELAGATAQAPRDLAEAMFTVQSAGIQGSAGIDALDRAAKAAAIGMGSTRDVAQSGAGVMNAYSSANIGAAEATDVLVATARAGNFEASQLANSIGRVLPNAAALGVGLTDVGGAIALFTRTNGNAAQSVSQLDGLIRSFIKPTAEAKTALDAVGLSLEEVQGVIQNDGLVAGLQLLDEAFEGNRQQLAKVIPDSTGLTAAFQILDASAESLDSTFGAVGDSAGILDDAFGKLQDSDSFKFDQAINSLQVSLTTLGVKVLPIVAEAAQFFTGIISDAASIFEGLPGPIQTAVIALGGLAASISPLLIVGGKLVALVGGAGGLTASFSKLGAVALNPYLLALTATVGAGILVWKNYADRQQEAVERAERLTEALRAMGDPLVVAVDRFGAFVAEVAAFRDAADNATTGVANIGSEFARTELQSAGLLESFNNAGLSLRRFSSAAADTTGIGALRGELGILALEAKKYTDAELADAFADLGAKADELNPKLAGVVGQILESAAAGEISAAEAFRLVKALEEQGNAYGDAIAKQKERAAGQLDEAVSLGILTTSTRNHVVSLIESAKTHEEIEQLLAAVKVGYDLQTAAQDNAASSAGRARAALEPLNGAYATMAGSVAGFASAVAAAAPALSLTDDAAIGLITTQNKVTTALEAQRAGFDAVTASMAPYRAALDGITGGQRALDSAILASQSAYNSSLTLIEQLADANGRLAFSWRDGTAEAIRAEQGAQALATAYRNEVFALIETGASIEEVNARHAELAKQSYETAIAMGATEAEARALVATYFTIPESVRTVAALDAAEANRTLDQLTALVLEYGSLEAAALLGVVTDDVQDGIDEAQRYLSTFDKEAFYAELSANSDPLFREVARSILLLAGFEAEDAAAILDGDNGQLVAALDEAIDSINAFDGRSATATMNTNFRINGGNLVDPGTIRFFQGFTGFANGGIVEAYANGGVRENHVAQIAHAGAMRVWAEPETGGEAYIPLAQSKRPRSMAILDDVARRFGRKLTPMADGGIMHFADGGVSYSTTNSGVNVDVTVNVPEAAGGGINIAAGGIVVHGDAGGGADAIATVFRQICSEMRSSGTGAGGVSV